jgi:hypothetical protein
MDDPAGAAEPLGLEPSDPEPSGPEPSSLEPSGPEPPALEPLHVDTARVVLAGTLVWLVALVVTVAVPGLHHGDRDWWPWAALSGTLLGLLGLVYVRRGRGNAAAQ